MRTFSIYDTVRMKRIYLVSFVSLIALFVMVLCFLDLKEKEIFGPSVDLVEAHYGKSISYAQGTLFSTITVDANGELFFQDRILDLTEFEAEFSKYISDQDFKYHAVTIRVDGRCQFGDLQPILKVLNNFEITDPKFSVWEK